LAGATVVGTVGSVAGALRGPNWRGELSSGSLKHVSLAFLEP
jgi:hypothetical protein